MTDLPTLPSAADTVANDEDDPQSLALLLRAGSSLGGALPKAHVRDSNGQIAIASFPVPATTGTRWPGETVALDLAAAAGVWVPENQVVSIAGRDVLIVHGFDGRPDGRRVGYTTSMLSARPPRPTKTGFDSCSTIARAGFAIVERLGMRRYNFPAESGRRPPRWATTSTGSTGGCTARARVENPIEQ